MPELSERLVAALIQRAQELELACQRRDLVLTIGRYNVQVAPLAGSPEPAGARRQLENLLGGLLQQWRQSTQAAANDIYLFLVGPAGSGDDPDWQAIAEEIERDDRLCRKLVWLPGPGAEPAAFLRRTFLARPWVGARVGSADALAVLQHEVGIPASWQDALREPDLQGRDLVERLLTLSGENRT